MKLNIKWILLLEKLGAIGYLIIPEFILRFLKSLFRNKNKRYEVLSNTRGYFIMRINKARNNFDMCLKTCGFNPKDKTALEFGTGGHGIDLVMLYLMGAKKIYTVDIAFFGLFNLHQAIDDMNDLLDDVIDQFKLDKEETYKRYQAIKDELNVQNVLSTMNVTFLTFNSLLKKKGIIRDEIDFFFSESALQRVPLKQLAPLLDNVTFSQHAVMFHKINCSDINILPSRLFRDTKLWRFDYLKYSDLTWDIITTKRFGSQNRLRQSNFTEFFRRYGFNTAFSENYYHTKDDIERCRKANFHHKFKIMDPENVAIANFRITSQKGFPSEKSMIKSYFLDNKSKEIQQVWTPEFGLTGS